MTQINLSKRSFDPLEVLKQVTSIHVNPFNNCDEQKKFYKSARWKKLRSIVLNRDPICKLCNNAYSEQVDHINEDWTNNHMKNLQGVCASCHSKKTRNSQTSASKNSCARVGLSPPDLDSLMQTP